MRSVFTILAALVCSPTCSFAQAASVPPAPTFGQAFNDAAHRKLEYRCLPVGASEISCDFTEVSVYADATEERRAEAIESDMVDFRKTVGSPSYELMCDFLTDVSGVITGKIDPAAALSKVLDGKAPDAEAISAFTEDMASKANDPEFKAWVSAGENFCRSKSEEDFRILANRKFDMDKQMCRISTAQYTLRFSLVGGSWVAKSDPQGDCGVTNLSRFVGDPNGRAYNFEFREVTANPEAPLPWGTPPNKLCKTLDRSEKFTGSPNTIGFSMECHFFKHF